MKKFNVLLMAAFCGVSAIAADFEWNDTWVAPSQASTNAAYGWWYGNAAVPDPLPVQQKAIITKAAADFDYTTCDFEEVWASLSDNYKYAILNIIGGDANNKIGESDGHIKWAGTYDNENIYLFIRADKGSTPTEGDKIEVMVSPYVAISGVPDPKDAYARYLQFGAWKAGFSYSSIFAPTSDVCTGDIPTQGVATTLPVPPSAKTENDNASTKWIVVIPHYAIIGDEYEGYLNLDGDFSEADFNALNDEKGLCFDIKYVENDGSAETNVWWNAIDNNGFQSNAYSGLITAVDNTAIEGSAVQDEVVSNMKITSTQIQLNEPVDVKILNASGMLIKSVNNAVNVSISELPAGTYIVVAGNETETFVK